MGTSCFAICAVVLGCLLAGADCEASPFFDYTHQGMDWRDGQCGARERQSPIDLGSSAPWGEGPEKQFFFQYSAVDSALIQNNGHSIAVELAGLGIGGVTFNDERYTAHSMNFHVMSEHTIRGMKMPLEVHLVHKADSADKALVIAILFDVPPAPVQVDAHWQTVYSRGSYGEFMSSPAAFNGEFHETLNGIMRRECDACADSQKDVYYRRKKHSWDYDAYNDLLVSWNGDGLHDKFDIYPTYTDALMDTNAWLVCQGNVTLPNPTAGQPALQVGFPGYCGPAEFIIDGFTDHTYVNGQKSYRWSVRREVPQGYSLLGEGKCSGGLIGMSSFTSPSMDMAIGVCAAECNLNQACQFFTLAADKACQLFDLSAQGCIARIPSDGQFLSYARLPNNTWTPPLQMVTFMQEGQESERRMAKGESARKESFLQRGRRTRSAQEAKLPPPSEMIGSNVAFEVLLAGPMPVKEEKLKISVAAAVDILSPLVAGGTYFEYAGSLTAPPCTERVTWLVRREPLMASMFQQDALRKAIYQVTSDYGNARGVMPLNGRELTVRAAVPGAPQLPAAPTGPPKPQTLAQNELTALGQAQAAWGWATVAEGMESQLNPIIATPPPSHLPPSGLVLGAMQPPAIQRGVGSFAPPSLEDERAAASVASPLAGVTQAMSGDMRRSMWYAEQATAALDAPAAAGLAPMALSF